MLQLGEFGLIVSLIMFPLKLLKLISISWFFVWLPSSLWFLTYLIIVIPQIIRVWRK